LCLWSATGNEISLALANGGFQLSPQGINSVLTRFDPNRAGLTLEAYTEVALYLASLKYDPALATVRMIHQTNLLAPDTGRTLTSTLISRRRSASSRGRPPACPAALLACPAVLLVALPATPAARPAFRVPLAWARPQAAPSPSTLTSWWLPPRTSCRRSASVSFDRLNRDTNLFHSEVRHQMSFSFAKI
jgi:hypothetical protein